MEALAKLIGIILLFIGSIVVFGGLISLPVMLLWDWVMPIVFGLGTITWLQAWGLMMLSAFLFKPLNLSSN